MNLSTLPEVVAQAELLWEIAFSNRDLPWDAVGERAGCAQQTSPGLLHGKKLPGAAFRWAVVAYCKATGKPYPHRAPFHPASRRLTL